MQKLRSSVRGTLNCPQRYLEGHLKTFGGGSRNSVRSGREEYVSNEFDGLTVKYRASRCCIGGLRYCF